MVRFRVSATVRAVDDAVAVKRCDVVSGGVSYWEQSGWCNGWIDLVLDSFGSAVVESGERQTTDEGSSSPPDQCVNPMDSPPGSGPFSSSLRECRECTLLVDLGSLLALPFPSLAVL